MPTVETIATDARQTEETSAESLTDCCSAPTYESTIRVGPDGRIAPDGKPKQVRKCMACGEIVAQVPFTINTEEKADWWLRKLANYDAEIERVKANSATRIAQLQADRNALESRYRPQVEQWARTEAEKRRRKTVTLLNGSLAFTSREAKLDISDLTDAMTTARAACPAAIKAVPASETLDTTAFLRAANAARLETGDIWPGVQLLPSIETFAIRPGGKEKEGKAGA